ncbi:hypothetical protein LXL04_005924 [Taraxacum kok-saghyz]
MENLKQDLHAAARSGDLVAVQTIISSNPLSVNSRDRHSRTPYPTISCLLPWAGQTQVVNILCKNKADIGAAAMDDMGAVHFAAQKGHLEVVKTLVSSGISVNSTNRKGMTPLHYAVQGSYIDLIKYLVKKGANVSVKNKGGKSALDLASNEEIRVLLSSPSESKTEDKESQPKTESCVNEDEKQKDESVKRKVEDNEVVNVESKKKKVALNHLLTSDDTQEEEE